MVPLYRDLVMNMLDPDIQRLFYASLCNMSANYRQTDHKISVGSSLCLIFRDNGLDITRGKSWVRARTWTKFECLIHINDTWQVMHVERQPGCLNAQVRLMMIISSQSNSPWQHNLPLTTYQTIHINLHKIRICPLTPCPFAGLGGLQGQQ